ncbi:hypothetical protein F5890DRAFT_1560229 [Lentinula detonsa]|uniref:Uncharacterized protein n=1 Tax=Lentinula detonsa TaxID=2804962 RepID=A0AA38UL78_9AGAR|nr:hypothetical protein F5890DRAFT_1560229 [Lentinula detonsa]
MSSTSNDNETIQQRRERILQAQAARQRAREEEIARQEAEFATEMERIEAEEKAAREAEERRKAEEQRVAEERRKAKEKRIAEEKRLAEEQKLEEQRRQEEEERIAEEQRVVEEQKKQQEKKAEMRREDAERRAEAKRREEERAAVEAAAEEEDEQEQTTAFAEIVEENKKEKGRAAKELEKRRKQPAKARNVKVEVPTPSSGSRRKTFKSKAIISEDSEDEGEDTRKEVAPRGVKRKRTIRMIAKGSNTSDLDGEPAGAQPPPDPSLLRPACDQCVLLGRPSECRPQSTRRQAQACAVCHHQRQRCSWSGDNAARRSRGKRVKLDDDEVYEGPAARVGERRFEGPGVAEQLATLVGQNKDLIDIARRSLVLQERMLHLMVIRERREEEAEKSEDEDEDGEGEDDEEVNEEKRREEVREGKKRAE